MIDLLITGGRVLDGTGAPGIYASVAVEGDRLRIFRGEISDVEAVRTIDATGKIVCPGFIDIHAHSSLVILDDPEHLPKVHQGVTTEVIGIDGVSYAPFRREEDRRDLIWLNSGFDGSPSSSKTWGSVSEYLDVYDGSVAVNIATMVGNSPIRAGSVGWNMRPPTAAEMDVQIGLLREAMEDGAFGLSTGLDYPPGSFADTDELVALSEQTARLGGFYHTHVRYTLGDRYLDPFREALEIGRRADVPVHLTHLCRLVTQPEGADPILELVEDARAGGMDVTFDMFPYPFGPTKVLIMFPQWIQDGGPRRTLEVLGDGEAREQLRDEVVPLAKSWDEIWLTNFRLSRNKEYEGRSVASVAEERGQHPVDTMSELLIEESLGVSFVGELIDQGTLPDFMVHPLYMVGSDAVMIGDFPSPMAYGCYPMFLSMMVREEGRLRLEEAIRKMTSGPAQRLGIPDRGILRDGFFADLVIFDPERVRPNVSRARPKQLSDGVDYVIVNGTVVIDQGRHTGALVGRALRKA